MLSFYWRFFKKIFRVTKKVLLVISVFFIIISIFVYIIGKEKPNTNNNPVSENRKLLYKTINDPKLNSTKTGKMQIALIKIINCGLVGEGCTNNPKDGDKNFDKSVFGLFSKLLITPFANPPASGLYWAYSGLQNAGFIPKSYAAEGIGFGTIKPFSAIWNTLRNVAYMILVLIIVSIGFMIMFRMKLNPQTVISVENSLPKIIISLLLITFSFAIAGFLIDLMYVSIILVVALIGPGGGLSQSDIIEKQRYFIQATPESIIGMRISWNIILWELPQALLNLVPLFGTVARLIGAFLGVFYIDPWLVNQTPLGDIIKAFKVEADVSPGGFGFTWTGLGELLKSIPGIAVFILTIFIGGTVLIPLFIGLLIFFTVIFIFFRLFFMLFSAYIKVLLLIIISPLYLLLEAIPGQSAFSSWIKNLVSELISFPALVAIFMLTTIILNATSNIGFIQFPFLVGIDPKYFSLIVGMGILFIAPDLIKIVKSVILPKPGPLDNFGLGVFFGGATTGLSGGLGELSKYAGLGYYIKPFGKLLQALPFGQKIFNTSEHGPKGPAQAV